MESFWKELRILAVGALILAVLLVLIINESPGPYNVEGSLKPLPGGDIVPAPVPNN